LIPESRSSGVLINGLDFGSWLEVAERMVGCASLAAADPRSWAAGSLYLCMPHYKRYRLTQSLAQSYWPAYGAVFPHRLVRLRTGCVLGPGCGWSKPPDV